MNKVELYRIKPFKALVIGDVMLDIHHYGVQKRHSAEAPISIFDVKQTKTNAGGAANVALNLKNLGAEVALLGVIGKDEAAEILKAHLERKEISTEYLQAFRHVPTSTKTRHYLEERQVFRTDREYKQVFEVQATLQSFVLKTVEVIHQFKPDIIVLQDYNKGVLHPNVIQSVIQQSKSFHTPIIVDPKFDNIDSYKGVQLIKPNRSEWANILQKTVEPIQYQLDIQAKQWMQEMNIPQLVVTLSGDGIYYNDGQESGIIPGKKINYPDVSGAGDTVIATLALGISQAWSLKNTAILANMAGSIVCEINGIQPIPLEELRKLWSESQNS